MALLRIIALWRYLDAGVFPISEIMLRTSLVQNHIRTYSLDISHLTKGIDVYIHPPNECISPDMLCLMNLYYLLLIPHSYFLHHRLLVIFQHIQSLQMGFFSLFPDLHCLLQCHICLLSLPAHSSPWMIYSLRNLSHNRLPSLPASPPSARYSRPWPHLLRPLAVHHNSLQLLSWLMPLRRQPQSNQHPLFPCPAPRLSLPSLGPSILIF